MRSTFGGSVLAAAAMLLSLTVGSATSSAQATRGPQAFEKEIKAFEEADKKKMPEPGGVVFTGSSSVRAWDLEKSFPGKGYINRGFGGSEMSDVVYYVDQTVIKYKPRLVVLYVGDNDINAGVNSEAVVANFDKYVKAIHAKLPQTKIIYIGIKPSVLRWANIDRVRVANELLKGYAARDDRIMYVDSDQAFLGWDEKPVPALLDRLHPSLEGLKIWTALLTPFLEEQSQMTASAGENK
jgi:lysophospholipase L1-like esterase